MFRSSLFLVAMELRNKKDIDKINKLYKLNLKGELFNIKSFRVFDIESMGLIDIDVDYYCRNNIVINGVDSGIKKFFKEKIGGVGKLNYVPLDTRGLFRKNYIDIDDTINLDRSVPFICDNKPVIEGNEIVNIEYNSSRYNSKGNVTFRVNFINGDFGIYFGGNCVYGDALGKTHNTVYSNWYTKDDWSNLYCLEHFGFTVDGKCAYNDSVAVIYDMANNTTVPSGVEKVLLGAFCAGSRYDNYIILPPSVKCILPFMGADNCRHMHRANFKFKMFISKKIDGSIIVDLYHRLADKIGINNYSEVNDADVAIEKLLSQFSISIELY